MMPFVETDWDSLEYKRAEHRWPRSYAPLVSRHVGTLLTKFIKLGYYTYCRSSTNRLWQPRPIPPLDTTGLAIQVVALTIG